MEQTAQKIIAKAETGIPRTRPAAVNPIGFKLSILLVNGEPNAGQPKYCLASPSLYRLRKMITLMRIAAVKQSMV